MILYSAQKPRRLLFRWKTFVALLFDRVCQEIDDSFGLVQDLVVDVQCFVPSMV